MAKREWTTDETFTAEISVAHFGERPLPNAGASWVVRTQRGERVDSGELPPSPVSEGGLRPLGTIRVPLAKLAAPAEYSMEVSVNGFANDWRFWVYPERLPTSLPDRVLVTKAWDDGTRSALKDGRGVLLLAAAGTLANTVPASFTTSFWSLLWFPNRPETMGVLCDPEHPALAEFPTSFHSDWQWWDLMSQARALVLNSAPAAYRPIVQVIDDPNRNYKLGAVLEARVGKGKLLVTTFDIETALDIRLAARQLRHSLMNYAASNRFDPKTALDMELLDSLLAAKAAAGSQIGGRVP
jgi:hypothetical protein